MVPVKIIQIENNTDKAIRSVMLPDNSIALVMHAGNSVYEIINGEKVKLPSTHICGQLTRYKEYVREPGGKSTILKLQPWATGMVMENLHELTNVNIQCDNILRPDDIRLFRGDPTIELLINQLFNQKHVDQSIVRSLAIIEETKGQIKVEDLAYQVSCSKRNFERKFKAATGLTPKEHIKNIRFNNSVELIQSSVTNLTEIAYNCGYFDQSHFIHDFKAIANVTPENYRGHILPIENWKMATRIVL